ncbi:chorismate synthase [Treponema parvum]|uniref:Chorismate synthase n=1 Tax=Treponema parvum TaxID=138851 RepID=A0A975IFN5_9SPIR|nr:chorismate synthase [Treponema parvum]QTQ14534.1 chorismate synthase [Treponema parvum]
MSGNTFGTVFRVTTFGESHGEALGVVIDGCPAGLKIDVKHIQKALNRRRPGAAADGKPNAAVTERKEDDEVEILSGVFNGVSQGTPISLLIRNKSHKSNDYADIANTFRPGHADFTYYAKYGTRDWRGGGRSSGRETAARVAAGAVAQLLLEKEGIKVTAFTLKAAGIQCKKIDFDDIEKNPLRAADCAAAAEMEAKIKHLKETGDSAGGIIECVVKGAPAGLGEPVFDKLDAEIAKAILSIGAVKGIEFGEGFHVADMTGSQNNDPMRTGSMPDLISFETNNSGGILGGISNGNEIVFRAAIKPVPSIFKPQRTITVKEGKIENTDLVIEGRHDVCICPRIVPVIEAMTYIVLADMYLRNGCTKT